MIASYVSVAVGTPLFGKLGLVDHRAAFVHVPSTALTQLAENDAPDACVATPIAVHAAATSARRGIRFCRDFMSISLGLSTTIRRGPPDDKKTRYAGLKHGVHCFAMNLCD